MWTVVMLGVAALLSAVAAFRAGFLCGLISTTLDRLAERVYAWGGLDYVVTHVRPLEAVSVLNEKQAAEWFGCRVEDLKAMRDMGIGPAYYRLGQMIRYKEQDLANFANSPQVEALFERVETGSAGVTPERIEPEANSRAPEASGAAIAAGITAEADPVQAENRPQFGRTELDPFRGLREDQIAGCGDPPQI